MIIIDTTYLEYADKFLKHFDEPIALRMLPQTLTNEELYAAIDDCIKRNENDLIEKYQPETDNVLY